MRERLLKAKRRRSVVKSELSEMQSKIQSRPVRRKDKMEEGVGENEPRSIEWEVEVSFGSCGGAGGRLAGGWAAILELCRCA